MPSHLAPRFGVLGAAASIRPAAVSAGDGTLANRKRDRPSIGRHDHYPRSTQGHTVHPGLLSYGRGKYRTVSRNYRGLAGFLLGSCRAIEEADLYGNWNRCPISGKLAADNLPPAQARSSHSRWSAGVTSRDFGPVAEVFAEVNFSRSRRQGLDLRELAIKLEHGTFPTLLVPQTSWTCFHCNNRLADSGGIHLSD